MHQGELGAGFLFSFADGNRSACQLRTSGRTPAASPARPCCVPGFGLRCTRPTPHKFLAICEPSKPRLCWGIPLSRLEAASPAASHALRAAKQMAWLLAPWVGLTQVGWLALAAPAPHTSLKSFLLCYKGVKNVLKTPGLGMVICQLSTLIYVNRCEYS